MADADADLLRILENQGFRELVSAHLFAAAVPRAPTIDDKHMLADHAREELAHFEVVAALYDQLAGRGLFELAAERAASIPSPHSWLEAAVAGYLVDRAAAVQLVEYKRRKDPRLSRVVDEILEHEREHLAAAETALRDQCGMGSPLRAAGQAHVERWNAIALGLLDPGESSERVAKAYADSVAQTMTACGFTLPAR